MECMVYFWTPCSCRDVTDDKRWNQLKLGHNNDTRVRIYIYITVKATDSGRYSKKLQKKKKFNMQLLVRLWVTKEMEVVTKKIFKSLWMGKGAAVMCDSFWRKEEETRSVNEQLEYCGWTIKAELLQGGGGTKWHTCVTAASSRCSKARSPGGALAPPPHKGED